MCRRKVASRRKAEDAIRSLVNAMVLQLESARVSNETLLVPDLLHSSEEIILREKKIKPSNEEVVG